MDHFGILKRAWRITWDYKVLWIFGFLIALTSGGGGGNGGGSAGGGNGPNNFAWPDRFPFDINPALIIGLVVACCAVILVLTLVGLVVHYVARTALIRMADEYERTGEKRSFRAGWRLGWNRRAWRMALVQFVVTLPLMLVFLAGLLLAASPLLLWVTKVEALGVIGTVISVGLIFLLVILLILVAFLLSPWLELAYRKVALDDRGVFAALEEAWLMLRRRLVDGYVMALIMLGIRWALLFVLIPLFLALIVVAAVIAGLPALLVGSLVALAGSKEAALLAGALIGIPVFLLLILVPGSFVNGVIETFNHTVWTLTYRELALTSPEKGEEEAAEEEAAASTADEPSEKAETAPEEDPHQEA